MKIKILATLFLFLIFQSGAYAININSCQTITSSGVYNLTTDILDYQGTVCFNITASNVILDCGNRRIDGVYSAYTYAIYSYFYDQIIIRNCVITDWHYGIYFWGSNYCKVENTVFNNNAVGINLHYSGNSLYRNLSFSNFPSGTAMKFSFDSNNNNITNSTFKNGYNAINLHYSYNNVFWFNRFESLSYYAIWTSYSGGNVFYNNLFNSSYLAYLQYSSDHFNTTMQLGQRIYSLGDYIGGNYWTNPSGNGYSDTCADSNRDGFCDEPYVLAENNIDYLPYSDEYIPTTTTTT
ncbi:MAG: NosD domain-containing protein, partial [Candidatus Bathyarchaeia archaeon]